MVCKEESVVDSGGGHGPLLAASRVDDDYLTVTVLAAGLAEILRRWAMAGNVRGRSDGLLPGAWRVAFAR